MKKVRKKRFDRYIGMFIEYNEYVSNFRKSRKVDTEPMKVFKATSSYLEKVKRRLEEKKKREEIYFE